MDAAGDGEAVLQFLLGKTGGLALEDTRSATSTSSSQASDATSSCSSSSSSSSVVRDEFEDEAHSKGVEDLASADADREGHVLELQPISEAGSEQEESEQEEEVETDRESSDSEHKEADAPTPEGELCHEQDAVRTTASDQEVVPVTGDTRDVVAETAAGTESEAEDEDGCGRMEQREVAAATKDSSPVPTSVLGPEAPGDGDVDTTSKRSDTRAASSPSAVAQHEAKRRTELTSLEKPNSTPSLGELALVGVVAVALLAYVVACIYSFVYRDLSGVVALPDASQFEHPVDMSNVSVRIVNPANHSAIPAHLLRLDWQLVNLPVDALRAGGPEVYRYDVFVNDDRVSSDVAIVELSPSEKQDKRITSVHRSITQYIRRDKIAASVEVLTVRVDVQMTTPGAFNQVTARSQLVMLVQSQESIGEADVVIKTPADGVRVQPGEDVVLTYVVGRRVARLRVMIDGAFVAWKTHVDDGVLLFQGLAEGAHEIALEVVGQSDNDLESSTSVRVLVGAT